MVGENNSASTENRCMTPPPMMHFLAFRVTKDCGNVAYKDFFEKVAVPEAADRNEIFAHTRASAEKTGDIIEFWLGILDVANMAKGTIDIFENANPAEFLDWARKGHSILWTHFQNNINHQRQKEGIIRLHSSTSRSGSSA